MTYTYDLRPGELVATDRVLHVDEVDEARAKLDAGAKLKDVARDLDATVLEVTEPEPTQQVAVDFDALVELVGEDKARELAGVNGG